MVEPSNSPCREPLTLILVGYSHDTQIGQTGDDVTIIPTSVIELLPSRTVCCKRVLLDVAVELKGAGANIALEATHQVTLSSIDIRAPQSEVGFYNF